MKKVIADIKAIVSEVCNECRVEGDDLQSIKVFVDNDKITQIDNLLRVYLPGTYSYEVLPISEEAEAEAERSPLVDVAEMLGIDMERQEGGKTVYLEEINLSRKFGAAKYSDEKPGGLSDFLSMLKKVMENQEDCGCSKCVARRKVAESEEQDHY